MRKYFKSSNSKSADGWMLAITGVSAIDDKNYMVDTHSLKGDMIPEHCGDAKLFAQLMSGLLNCYYNGIETKGIPPEKMMEHGIVNEEEIIPSPKNTEIPF